MIVPALRFKDDDGQDFSVWEKRNISKILKIGSGKDYKKLESGDIPVYGTGGYMLSVNDYLYDGESVCIGRKGTIDRPVLLSGKFWTVDTLFYTHSFISSLPKFIYALFQNIDWKNYNEASGVPSLSKSTIEKIEVFIPSLPEQTKIANFLTAVDQKISLLTQKADLLSQYKKGVMQQIFKQELRFKDDDGQEFPEWEEKTFADILIKNRLGGNYANSEYETNYPLIKMGNLDRGNIKLNKIEYINQDEVINPEDKIIYGDLFFNTRNTLDLVGKVAIWRNELPEAYYNSNLMLIKFDNNFFMNYRLNSHNGMESLKAIATGTTSVAAIYTKDLLKIKVEIPSLPEQTKIANFLTAVDEKITTNQTQLNAVKQYKQGLLQQMFV